VPDALLAADRAPLWPGVAERLGPMEARSRTAARYGNSWAKLLAQGVLRADAPVASLRTVDWHSLVRRWPGSAADWNHLRRAVSHFLTVHLGEVYHPLRREVVRAILEQVERDRVPDLDAPTFWRVVQAGPEHVQAAYVALVALGLRVGEYLRLRPEHLHSITKSVCVPGTKTAEAATVLSSGSRVVVGGSCRACRSRSPTSGCGSTGSVPLWP
jgi:integrase